MVLLGWATIGAYGAVYYSFGVLLQPVREATGWSVSALTAGFSAGVLLGGAGGVLAGRALDRIGPRPVLGVALGLGCTALLGASYAPELWHFIASWAIGAGAVAGGLYYHVTMATTLRLYAGRRAAAISVLTPCINVGLLLAFPASVEAAMVATFVLGLAIGTET